MAVICRATRIENRLRAGDGARTRDVQLGKFSARSLKNVVTPYLLAAIFHSSLLCVVRQYTAIYAIPLTNFGQRLFSGHASFGGKKGLLVQKRAGACFHE